MKLLHLRAEGFRGLPDRAFDFAPPGTRAPLDVVFVAGEPGSGKTTLLEAIIAAKEDVGAYGPRRAPAAFLRAGARAARLEATWLLSSSEKARAHAPDPVVTTASIFGEGAPPLPSHPDGLRALFAEHSPSPNRGKVEYFHADRALPTDRGARHVRRDGSPSAEARMRLTTSAEKYRSTRATLVDTVLASGLALAETLREKGIALSATRTDALAEIRVLLGPFLHDKAFDGIEAEGAGYRVRFVSRNREVLDLDELSAAERQGVLFAITFQRLGLAHSLVLIDTPELHLHPRHQAAFFGRLLSLGRDNQIIAATTSVELLATARPEQVIDLGQG